MDLVELSRLLENLIRIGTIFAVDHDAERCRVQSGHLQTNWLRWLALRAGETRTWEPPTVGEQCIVLSPSGAVENGIVLYGINSDVVPPPSHAPAVHVIAAYPDGARIEYNHASSHLSVTGIKTAHIEAATSVTLDTPDTYVTGRLTVEDLLTYRNGLRGFGGNSKNMVTGDFIHGDGGVLSSYGIVLNKHDHEKHVGNPT